MTPQIKQRIDQLRRGEVPEGYTKTKEGIIPSDWTIKKMKQWISLEERPVTLQDDEDYELVTVRRAYGGVDSRGIYKGKDVLVKTYFSVAKDDFIISKRQIAHGACGLVPEKLGGAVVSNEYNVFKANEGTNIHFFNLMMQLPHYKRLFYLMSDGVHIEKLLFKTGDWMKRSLALPPLAEQKKIAEILSAQDKLIALKEKLIEEKKRQKKYLMQQLLTGKKRLPGFSGEWESKKIGELCDILDTCRKPLNATERSGKSKIYPYYGANGIVDYIDEYLIDDSVILLAEDGGNFEDYSDKPIAYWVSGKCWVNNHAHILKPRKSFSDKFIFYSLEHKDIRLYINGTTRSKLTQEDLISITVYLPNNVCEQNKIAEVLMVMDQEIELLKNTLCHEKQKKKALMQLLLSGVVRV